MAKRKSTQKHPAKPQAAPMQPTQPEPQPTPPDTESKTARWMGALCYLSVLIIIPACSAWRKDDFVRFHLNQGLALLMLATICGVIALIPGAGQIGTTLTVLVDLVSLIGLVFALRRRKQALPVVDAITRAFHPF